MGNYICLDKNDSTTRRLFRDKSAESPGSELRRDKKDKRNCGGLRLKGYFKKSSRDRPLITIITVVLNEPQALEKTIASVLEQTYDNIECIIIDGASSDPTIEVIKRNEDKIDSWISEPDNGIFDAMNKGIDLASGEWINFMNAGDYFYQKDTVETVFNKDYGKADFIYGHTHFLGGDFNGVVKVWDFKILWKTMVFTHQSLFTRSDILKNRKFDTRFSICADYDIIFNSYMQGLTFFNSDTVIAAFDPGFSDVSRARMAYEKWKVVKKHRNDFRFHWFYLQLFLKRLFRDIGKRLERQRKN
jgi:glycosyltransferase involved in cell wall biosynthesis